MALSWVVSGLSIQDDVNYLKVFGIAFNSKRIAFITRKNGIFSAFAINISNFSYQKWMSTSLK